MSDEAVRLWSDEPSPVDLLAFGAVAETAVEAVLDDALDPIALGVSGPWGSGKSTVLRLIEAELKGRSAAQADEQILVIQSDPWRYDPAVGAKATLISEVLSALQAELIRKGGASEKAQNRLLKLAKRVKWVKALKVAAKSSITLQLPSLDDLSSLISEEPGEDGDEGESKTLDEFRTEFAELLKDEALRHVRRVVVLVDDLDRCLPDTVVETLETMRLFLSVQKMSFVIAADEDRVADALRERYPKGEQGDPEEEPARLYLHKIVQTTLKLPALSRFDTEAYLLLLQLQNRPNDVVEAEKFTAILAGCTGLRKKAGSLDDLAVPTGLDITVERQFAARLTPMLYEKLRGSPRRVKRFLNDLNVRASIAHRRGIDLDIAVVAKLMVLELLLPKEFEQVLDWLARGELRDRLTELERRAGRGAPEASAEMDDSVEADTNGDASKSAKKAPGTKKAQEAAPEESDEFSDNFIRWAKLPPPLTDTDLSPYLHLAASFGSTPLIDVGLPDRLRDIAANLLSSSRVEQKSVTDDDLRGLGGADATLLVEHLGRMARDRPAEMSRAVAGILRVTGLIPETVSSAEKALKAVPAANVKVPVILHFGEKAAQQFSGVLTDWSNRTSDQPVKNAIANALAKKAAS